MKYEYISWNRFYRLCGVLYQRISHSDYVPDLIVAITRGGYPVARVMADYFNLMDLVGLKIEHYRGPQKMPLANVRYPLITETSNRHVLLVDDVSDSGDTFDVALRYLRDHGEPATLRTAVLHHKLTSSEVPDYYAQRIRTWRWITYPWALVEDLTVIASRMTPMPKHVVELKQRLLAETGMKLPAGVFTQIAPIVLARVAEIR